MSRRIRSRRGARRQVCADLRAAAFPGVARTTRYRRVDAPRVGLHADRLGRGPASEDESAGRNGPAVPVPSLRDAGSLGRHDSRIFRREPSRSAAGLSLGDLASSRNRDEPPPESRPRVAVPNPQEAMFLFTVPPVRDPRGDGFGRPRRLRHARHDRRRSAAPAVSAVRPGNARRRRRRGLGQATGRRGRGPPRRLGRAGKRSCHRREFTARRRGRVRRGGCRCFAYRVLGLNGCRQRRPGGRSSRPPRPP